jgi:hypothetical protein
LETAMVGHHWELGEVSMKCLGRNPYELQRRVILRPNRKLIAAHRLVPAPTGGGARARGKQDRRGRLAHLFMPPHRHSVRAIALSVSPIRVARVAPASRAGHAGHRPAARPAGSMTLLMLISASPFAMISSFAWVFLRIPSPTQARTLGRAHRNPVRARSTRSGGESKPPSGH